jgi:hypothetical protein
MKYGSQSERSDKRGKYKINEKGATNINMFPGGFEPPTTTSGLSQKAMTWGEPSTPGGMGGCAQYLHLRFEDR